MAVWLSVALGGAIGSVARYGVANLARTLAPGWPWGTLAVNVLGSFAIGVLFAAFALRPSIPEWIRLGLMTGLLGGFTTFSAFSVETLDLLRTGTVLDALGYVCATLALGMAACGLGLWSTRLLFA